MQGLNCVFLSLLKFYGNYSLDFATPVRHDSRDFSCSFEKDLLTLRSFSQCKLQHCNFQWPPNHSMSCSWFDSCSRNLEFSNVLYFGLCATKHSQKCRQLDGAVAGRSRLTATVRGSLLKHISQIFYCLYFCESHWPPSALHAIVIFSFPFAILTNLFFIVNTKKC